MRQEREEYLTASLLYNLPRGGGGGSAVYDGVIFFWPPRKGDGRDISNFLITPRGANRLSLPLPLSRFAPSFTLPIYAAVAPYPAPPPSSISHQPAIREGEPALLYLLLRYRPSSKSRRHACNTRNTRTLAHSRGREKERIRPFERGGGVRSPPKASLSLSFERGITTIDANSSLCSRHFCSRGGGE